MFTGGKQSVEDPPGVPGNTYKGGWVPRLHGKDVFRIHDPHTPPTTPLPSGSSPLLSFPSLEILTYPAPPSPLDLLRLRTLSREKNICLWDERRWVAVWGAAMRCDSRGKRRLTFSCLFALLVKVNRHQNLKIWRMGGFFHYGWYATIDRLFYLYMSKYYSYSIQFLY